MWITVKHLPFMQVTHIHLNTPLCSKTRGYHVEIMKLQEYFLPFWVFCRMLKGSGDEGMLTRAPPDHQATCFNIHDITSSLGGRGCTEMKLHAAGSSHWRKTDSLSLSQQ